MGVCGRSGQYDCVVTRLGRYSGLELLMTQNSPRISLGWVVLVSESHSIEEILVKSHSK